ncbi:hypothetical protein E4U42_000176 [Claviceps africana]|uniref:Tetratricopeptide repeat protein 1 n=1 Tax=Claviceps africana TaxID=83212 RepID=A0A8K0J033_9HYPO|nr:hypothetical protein E4U42_000176 [Claviceps africana]
MAPPTGQTVPAPEPRGAKQPVPTSDADEPREAIVRFSPDEERALVEESNAAKAEANALYSENDYDAALSRYQDALSTCPNYLHYERAVLQSNMAACYLQLEQWKEAIKAATSALDGLARLEEQDKESEVERRTRRKPEQRLAGASGDDENDKSRHGSPAHDKTRSSRPCSPPETSRQGAEPGEAVDDEIISAGATRAGQEPQTPSQPAAENDHTSAAAAESKRREDARRIRTKALLRRARARAEAGGWQNLAGAEEDYKLLSEMPGLGAADRRTVQRQLGALPARTKAAQEAETAEMWGKLRTLGDGILKPFGLSTSNFQMVKDEKTGGYSMNFSSGDGSGKK